MKSYCERSKSRCSPGAISAPHLNLMTKRRARGTPTFCQQHGAFVFPEDMVGDLVDTAFQAQIEGRLEHDNQVEV